MLHATAGVSEGSLSGKFFNTLGGRRKHGVFPRNGMGSPMKKTSTAGGQLQVPLQTDTTTSTSPSTRPRKTTSESA